MEVVLLMSSQGKIKQAVILCGGLGTRLRPLTDNLPKPMVPVNGKPFLHHLLTQLSEQGTTHFVLLTGYLGEKIRDYFGDGSQWGWFICYSHGPVAWDTGRRVWEARNLFDSRFLLLYSDNFVQFNFQKLLALHCKQNVPISLLLAPKEKGNIRVSGEGRIEAYDKTRSGEGFNYVEVGYMLIERDLVLEDFPSYENHPDFNFSTLLQKFVLQSRVAGLVVIDPYHSISDPDRLQLMCEYLKPKKILLIDRDGTINRKAPQGEYVTSWSRFEWIPEARQAMKILAKDSFQFIVITNQAGIARKMIDPIDLEEIHRNMIKVLAEEGIDILKVYIAPHHWEENSFMRKPSPGMFFQAAKEFKLRMDRCLYVGDDKRDCQAALNAGCGMVYVSSEKQPLSLAEYPSPYFKAETIQGSIAQIRETYLRWEAIA